jgi:hypothetical protein
VQAAQLGLNFRIHPAYRMAVSFNLITGNRTARNAGPSSKASTEIQLDKFTKSCGGQGRGWGARIRLV